MRFSITFEFTRGGDEAPLGEDGPSALVDMGTGTRHHELHADGPRTQDQLTEYRAPRIGFTGREG